jgi:alpha-glucosidase (family GH31 glycosyl hydrolase)
MRTPEDLAALPAGVNNPPYKINHLNYHAPLNTKTMDMDAVHYGGALEYDAHSLYGFTESIATRQSLEKFYGKRAFVLSRSTYSGSGKHTAHWLGDNYSTFQSMQGSIADAMIMNMLGLPMNGADICGFVFSTTEELCVKWHAWGAYYAFSRNHNEVRLSGTFSWFISVFRLELQINILIFGKM